MFICDYCMLTLGFCHTDRAKSNGDYIKKNLINEYIFGIICKKRGDNMQGVNHIIANTCSGILGAECLFLFKNILAPKYTDFIPYINPTTVYDNIIDFLTPDTTSVTMVCIWWTIAVVLFYLGTLLPDCDSKKSIIGRIIYIPVEHRTWTHTIWIPLCIFICSIWLPILFYFGAGYLLHLLWDNLSVGGVCFLYPINGYKHYGNTGAKVKQGHWLKLYRTGKVSEGIVVGVLVVTTIFVSIYMFMNLL